MLKEYIFWICSEENIIVFYKTGGKHSVCPKHFALSRLCGGSGCRLPPGYNQWLGSYTRSGWNQSVEARLTYRWRFKWLPPDSEKGKTNDVRVEGCGFLAENWGGSCAVVFCHAASPWTQQQPAGRRQKKWQSGILSEVIKLGCFWLNRLRRTDTR